MRIDEANKIIDEYVSAVEEENRLIEERIHMKEYGKVISKESGCRYCHAEVDEFEKDAELAIMDDDGNWWHYDCARKALAELKYKAQ